MQSYSLDEWQDVCRPFYDVRIRTEPEAFGVRLEVAGAGDLILTKVRFSAQVLAHDPTAIKGFDHEYLLFERYRRGESRGVAGETATRIDAGTLHLVDMGQPYATSTTDVVTEGVLIPYHLVGFDPSRHERYVSVPRATPRGRLLDTALDALAAAVGACDPQEAIVLERAFAGLVERLMLKRRNADGPPEAGVATDLALRGYIEAHLGDPRLGAARLCSRFGLSRASLYRRFRGEGGVERYIAGRRLDRCFLELCSAAPVRGRVKRVATKWGYPDPGNFNRRFRDRFDMAPTECVASGAVPPADADVIAIHHVIRQWMRRLGH